jgi:hypothetical protein
MEKTRPFETIAARFQVSRESAKYFLIQVQKSFKTEKPPHRLILDFMNSHEFEALPHPYQVAAMMNEGGIWAHPLQAEPPALSAATDEVLFDE